VWESFVSTCLYEHCVIVSSHHILIVSAAVVVLQEMVMTTGVMQIDDCLLEGHLGITKELVAMQSVQKRFFIGAENGGCGLIKVCVDLNSFHQFTGD